jgi:hypothetical protein
VTISKMGRIGSAFATDANVIEQASVASCPGNARMAMFARFSIPEKDA